MSKYKYKLENYKIGGFTKHTCPSCGKRKCFTYYVDADTGEPLKEAETRCLLAKPDLQLQKGFAY